MELLEVSTEDGGVLSNQIVCVCVCIGCPMPKKFLF